MAKERQMSTKLEGIREDHRQRYVTAIQFAMLKPVKTILDVGCGVGYGSYMMAEAGFEVWGFDQSTDALEIAQSSYIKETLSKAKMGIASNPCFYVSTIEQEIINRDPMKFDLMTAFEILEHTESAEEFLREKSKTVRYLIGSVPNQDKVPFNKKLHHYHVRHYRPAEIIELLDSTGWTVLKAGGQAGKRGRDSVINWKSTEGARSITFRAASKNFEKAITI